ncbi:hypothetical protein WJX73_004572 [Symbiochloris irregularis]|uniref:TAFII28-like protein domain-containing protein n=1 Tax=Symbiochloris irregularis TaxID=706552 RepID=A0AAW1NPK3_9CHLO
MAVDPPSSELLPEDLVNTDSAVGVRSLKGDISQLSEEQQERLAAYRRSKLSQRSMGRIYETIAGHKASPQVLIVLCGVGKLFVGDLTEAAVALANRKQYATPLEVEHILAAQQQLQRRSDHPPSQRQSKRLKL